MNDCSKHAGDASPSQLARRLTAAASAAVSPLLESIPIPAPSTSETTSSSASPPCSQQQPQHIKRTAAIHDLIAGGVSGSAGIIVGHPLDSIKVRMQMMSHHSSTVAVGGRTRSSVISLSELGSLWKGIGAPLAMAAVVNASVFFTYGGSTRLWDKHFDATTSKEDSISSSSSSSGAIRSAAPFKTTICGGLAGVVSSFIICPTEHVKTKLQTQKTAISFSSSPSSSNTSTIYKDSYHATSTIIQTHGLTGLYRGLLATVARQGPGFAIYFSAYDRLKDYIITHSNLGSTANHHQLMASILSGGIAGSLSWAAIYPIDLIKSRIQALPLDCALQERSIMHVGGNVVRQHGWMALYRGFGITILRAFPVNAIIFPTYEFTLSALRKK